MITGKYSYLGFVILAISTLSLLTAIGAIITGIGFFIVVAIINLLVWCVILYFMYKHILDIISFFQKK